MKDNFRTLVSGIMTKSSSLYAQKDSVYTKDETYSKEEIDKLPPIEHEHSYLYSHPVSVPRLPTDGSPTIAYGNGKFVAVSSNTNSGASAYSEDGITWTETTMPSSQSWTSVTYGNGKFVVVNWASNGRTAYSEDGITWIATNMRIYERFVAVTYGDGKFVAVGYNAAAYSEDGITWTKSNIPVDPSWSSVTYGNGKFVAVGYTRNSDVVAYSEDGIAWTEISMNVYAGWNAVTYGNGKFVVVGNPNNAAYSEDGIAWTEISMPVDSYWSSVTYDNGKFVAVGKTNNNSDLSNAAAYSEDGITWTEISMPVDMQWTSVAYGNGKFVAAAYPNVFVYSYDGIHWYDHYIEVIQDGDVVTDIMLAPMSAKPGQALLVDAVDENDKPIRWIATDLPEIPTSVSQLTNDAGYITADDLPEIPTSVSQLTNDAGYITAADIPEIPGGGGSGTSTPAIIDVTELPTENINEQALYRLLTGTFVVNQYTEDNFTCRCVEELPEIGEPVTTDMFSVYAYYNIADRNTYGYINDTLAAMAGVPAGWYSLDTLAPLFNVSWSGVITDIKDDPCDDGVRLLLSYDYYTFKDEWTKLIFASEKPPKFDITWDGDMTDRFSLDMTALGFPDTYMVKVSDMVLTKEEIIGCRFTNTNGYDVILDESLLDENTYPGAYNITDGGAVVIYSADDTGAALGLPAGYLTNGTYFVYIVDGFYTNRLVAPPRITKIDGKYLGISVDADSLGLHHVAMSGDYNDLWNRPNLSNYVTESRVNTLISNAIGTAIGGSY